MKASSGKLVRMSLTAVILIFTISFSVSCTKGNLEDKQESASRIATSGIKATTAARTSAVKTVAPSSLISATAANASVAAAEATSDVNLETVETETAAQKTDEVWAEDIVIEVGKMDIDYGGKTIVIGTSNANEIPIDAPDKDPKLVIVARREKVLEEKYNCKIEWKAESYTPYYNAIVNAALSGIKYVDIAQTAASHSFLAYVKQSIYVPLDDYIDYESPIVKANKYMYNGTFWRGKHYGIPTTYRYACGYFMYNRDILDREGQPDILDLMEMNQWTWDTFLNIAKACTRDTDGDGVTDQYGATSASNLYFCKYLLYSNNNTLGMSIMGDQLVLNLTQGPAIRTFQFVSDCFNVHKVFKASAVATGLYPQGKAAFLINNWEGPNRDCLKLGIRTFLATMPLGPDATNYANINTPIFCAVTSTSDRPDLVAKIFLENYTVWTEDLNPIPEIEEISLKYYPADWAWNPNNTDRVITTERENRLVYQEMYKYYKPDFSDGIPNFANTINSMIITPIINGTSSVSQAVFAAETKLDSMIEAFR